MIILIATNNTGNTSETPGRSQNAAYCKYVADAGYTPILAPMEADPEALVGIADGLLLAGGIDIDPIYYGVSNIASLNVDPEKDDFERKLFHKFREYGKPIFGICRGFQMIFRELLFAHPGRKAYNKYFEYLENIDKHSQSALNVARRFPSHQVRTNLSSLIGIDSNELKMVPVNSMHHQAVAVNYMRATKETNPEIMKHKGFSPEEPCILHIKGVELVAWSMRGVHQPSKTGKEPDYDNYWSVLEAAKIHDWGAPIMGVQWHPEELKDVRPIRNFFGEDTKKKVVIGGI